MWVKPALQWEGDYHPVPTDHSSDRFPLDLGLVILPFCLGKEQLTSSAELAALEVGTKCRVVGEVLSVRK